MRATAACALVFVILAGALLAREVVLAPGGVDAPAAADLFAFYRPQLAYAFAELGAGRLPLWNPHQACGTPLLAHPALGLFYPLYAPFLLLDADAALALHIVLHLALAALFTFLCCRAAGMSVGAALVAGVAYAGSGGVRIKLFHPTFLIGAAAIPLLFWLVLRLFERPSRRRAAALAVGLGIALLGSELQFVYFAALALAPLVLVHLLSRRRAAWRPAAWLAVAALLGVGIALVRIVPGAEVMARSWRPPGGLTLEAASIMSLPPATFLRGLLTPVLPAQTPWWELHGLRESYLGLLPLLLAAVGLLLWPRRTLSLPIAAAGVAAVWYAAGAESALYRWLFVLPAGSWFRGPDRVLVVTGFAAAFLSGAGLDALRRRMPSPRWGAAAAVVAAVVFLDLAFARSLGGRLPAQAGTDPNAALYGEIARRQGASRTYLAGAIERGPLRFTRTAKAGSTHGLWLATDYDGQCDRRLAAYLDALGTRPVNPMGYTEFVLTPDNVQLADLMGIRFYALDDGAAARPGERFAPLAASWQRLWSDGRVTLYEHPGALPRAFVVGRVEVVPDPDEILRRLRSADLRRVAFVERRGAGLPAGSGVEAAARAHVLEYGPTFALVETRAAHAGLLVLTDQYDPWWEATVDGAPAPIYRTDYLFRGVPVPPGTHRVAFRYRPWSIAYGAAGSLLALLVALTLVATGRAEASADRRRVADGAPDPGERISRRAGHAADLPGGSDRNRNRYRHRDPYPNEASSIPIAIPIPTPIPCAGGSSPRCEPARSGVSVLLVSASIETAARAREHVFPGSPRLHELVSDAGERWDEARRRLVPRYERVWRDIAAYYAALLAGFAGHLLLSASAGTAVGLATAPLAALWLGYWIAALVNFVHEAAHFNLHPDKRRNDRLADVLLCPLAGTAIAPYRDLHWRHHLHLGTPRDTEVSYRERPGLRFVLRTLFGLKILEVLRTRRQADARDVPRAGGQAFGLIRSAALHGAIVVVTLLAGFPGPALAWAIAVAAVYPFCNALRQTLEHRPGDAGGTEGEAVGAVNRLFGADVLSRTFGSAGFNRHLLHHWHPSASYTTFDDLEAYLARTPLAPRMAAARASYWGAWRQLAATRDSLSREGEGQGEGDRTDPALSHPLRPHPLHPDPLPHGRGASRCPVCESTETAPHAVARDTEYATSTEAFTYRRCRACAAIFIDPPPADRLAEIYPKTYYSFRGGGTRSLIQGIKEWLDARLFRHILRDVPGERLRVLDVGGGSGWMLSVVRAADPRVGETHEVDLDESARPAAEAAGHVFHCLPIERFDSDRRFDLVLMLNIIEHVADPAAVLRQIAALLPAHGRILIKTPNTDTLDGRLFRHRNWGGYHCPRHWVLFTADNLAALARRSGLEVVWVRYTQGAPQWAPSLLGLLADRGWLQVSVERPMYTHRLYPPLLALTAAVDFVRGPFMKTAQMFVLLEPRAEGGGRKG